MIEESAIEKELSVFFVKIEKPIGGVIPVNVNVAEVVFGQTFGVTTQAGIVSVVASVMK